MILSLWDRINREIEMKSRIQEKRKSKKNIRMKNSRVKLESFKKLITNREQMKENGKNIEKELLELLEEEYEWGLTFWTF